MNKYVFLLLCHCLFVTVSFAKSPNIVVIFTDDQGYGDLSCYGSKGIKTPSIDRIAEDGVKFTDFYVAAPICSSSRASLLTGQYPARHGVSPSGVFFPRDKHGLSPKAITIAEVLKRKSYATACIGKWHLGHKPDYLPTSQGFDEYFGVPYSNDMWLDAQMPFAQGAILNEGLTMADIEDAAKNSPAKNKIYKNIVKTNWVPLMRGQEIIEYPAAQETLTSRYTDEAIKFIEKNKEKPFFLYLAHSMPHVPLYVSPEFEGKSEEGLYGDSIEEIDANVGRILAKLKELNLDDDTLLIFTSDNGPWEFKNNKKDRVKGNKHRNVGGSAGPLRGAKFKIFEGGVRVPCVMRWPNKIPAGSVSSQVLSTMDFLPTFAAMANAELSSEIKIDGKDMAAVLKNPADVKTLHDIFYYHINGLRKGDWKLVERRGDRYKWTSGYEKFALFNLREDIAESKDLSATKPEIKKELWDLLMAKRKELKK